MILNHIILAMLWVIYCILHSALASEWFKRKLRKRIKYYEWYRLWYTVFSFVFLIVLLYYQIITPTIKLFVAAKWLLICGAVIGLSGLVLMAVCIRKYFMSLSGLRSLVIENYSNELQITGIHKYMRHPLYLGTFAFIWGMFLFFPYLSLLVANVIITVYTLIGIGLEEQKLINEFGDSYIKYRAAVPRLIPFLKLKRRV